MSFYPSQLEPLFVKLLSCGVKPVIVGGFVRDRLFGLDEVKDIDIELYGVKDFASLEMMVCEFGKVNSFGKSFGVCHLVLDAFEIDFSLPRLENKNGFGHKDFLVTIAPDIDFKTASARRDFTINSIGYDVNSSTFLDPYGGMSDLEAKVLREVDAKKFKEDPLRVLRCARFCAKYELVPSNSLLCICKEMVQNGELEFLPKERIFAELVALINSSKKPSVGLGLLRELGVWFVDAGFERVDMLSFDENRVLLALAYLFNGSLGRISDDKRLLKHADLLWQNLYSIGDMLSSTRVDFDLAMLATRVNISLLLDFYRLHFGEDDAFLFVRHRSSSIGVLHGHIEPLVGGKELIACGLLPSKEFSSILKKAYEAQLMGEFDELEKAKKWVEAH